MKLEDNSSACKNNLMIESELAFMSEDLVSSGDSASGDGNEKDNKKILCGALASDQEESFFIPARQINVTFCPSDDLSDDEAQFMLKWSVVTVKDDDKSQAPPFVIDEFKGEDYTQNL